MFLIKNKLFILFFSIFVFVIVIFIYKKISFWIYAKRLKKRFNQSRHAEKDAEKYLKKKGFTILETQKSKPIHITIGDKIHQYLIRIDYLVKRNGRIYVVEVKSGDKSPYITNRDTRRQMLEYYLAYKPSGILLLNMKNKNLSEVKFQFENTSQQWIRNTLWFFAGIAFSLLVYYLFFGG